MDAYQIFLKTALDEISQKVDNNISVRKVVVKGVDKLLYDGRILA